MYSSPVASEFLRPVSPTGGNRSPRADNGDQSLNGGRENSPRRGGNAAFTLDGVTNAAREAQETFREAQDYVRQRYKYHDRGTGRYEVLRKEGNRPYLVMTGEHAGRSKVKYVGFDWRKWRFHLWRKDFFTSISNIYFGHLCMWMLLAYATTYFLWAIVWWITWKISPRCVEGFGSASFVRAYLFSVETQATIGYGTRSAGPCLSSAIILTMQNVSGMILDAVCLGIIFAKISHPKHRGRSLCISESAVIARRDGQLKFMFRIADIRSNTACDATLRAELYTWGDGRQTMEGEFLPVRTEPLKLENMDGMLLLPQCVEHVIDERSPMFGLDHDTLDTSNCEIVITFEGVSEFGDSFMVRQSYLANEIHWGHMFSPVVQKAAPGYVQHCVDLSRFHDVEIQPGVAVDTPSKLSKLVLAGGATKAKMLPYPLLGENTLVISEHCTIIKKLGQPCIQFRVGDTRPGQMLEVHVRAYLYEWAPTVGKDGEVQAYTMEELDLGYSEGQDRLMLRFPQTVCHAISEKSILSRFASAGQQPDDAPRVELVVVVEAIMYANSMNMMRSVTYSLPNDVKYEENFLPIVTRSPTGSPSVHWPGFHITSASTPTARSHSLNILKRATSATPAAAMNFTHNN